MASNFSTEGPQPVPSTERDLGYISDHVTVWIDEHIGVKDTYFPLKTKFNDNIQVLQSNNPDENEIDDESLSCTHPDVIEKLKQDIYCLKYFPTIETALDYIRANDNKKIFFISSGKIGKKIVPQIADLEQIKCIYIFCGRISNHVEWASTYIERITAMFEHQDNLLQRLTRDIARYVEQKGDQYRDKNDTFQARNCYSWAKKLLIRGKNLGDTGSKPILEKIEDKINAVCAPVECQTSD